MNKLTESLFKAKGITQHFLKANSPALLAAVGVSGVVTTAYLTAKASFRAARAIDQEEARRERRDVEPMDMRDKTELVWKLYIPPVMSGGLTISAIVVGTAIGVRRTAAIAAAYSITDKAFSEYKSHVVEQIGENKEAKIRHAIAEKSVQENPPGEREVMIAGPGNILCYERFTGRYFHSDPETLRKAENIINSKLNREMYAYLSDFYDLVGLKDTSASEHLGWHSDRLMELKIESALAENGVPCLSIEYNYTKAL